MENSSQVMTRQQYGLAYEQGCKITKIILMSKGVPEDDAQETAQAAWVRGWERLKQLREPRKALGWINTIAMNLYRSRVQRTTNRETELEEIATTPQFNLASIDVHRMLRKCKPSDRRILEWRYLEDRDIGDIARENRCTQTAVRVKLLRARRNFRKHFERQPLLQKWSSHRPGSRLGEEVVS